MLLSPRKKLQLFTNLSLNGLKHDVQRMKRHDLQGIRGLAIISVLLFHFFPSSFPNGYVGVDQFFVLSGFLMTLIFGSKLITRTSIGQFYYRRVKRILPLYGAVIVTVYILMFFVLPSTFRDLNKTTAIRAALLISNLPRPASENDYFVQLEQASDLFTHTWSLSVEMQFYLLVPALFLLFGLSLPISALFFLVIFCSSLGFQLLAESHTSFNSVFCRIWQFQTGMAAYYIGQALAQSREKSPGTGDREFLLGEEDKETTEKPQKTVVSLWMFGIFLLCLLYCSFWPSRLDNKIIRPASTLFTGLVIAVGGQTDNNPLSGRLLVYCGDISYSLYLLHWPLYIWVRYYYKNEVPAYLLVISAAILLSVVVSETFEKWYQTLDMKGVLVLLFLVYGLLAAAVFHSEGLSKLADGEKIDMGRINTRDMTVEEIIRMNEEYDRLEYDNLIIPNCIPNDTEHGFCSFEEGLGKNRILVLGNSYAANLAPLVNEAFRSLALNISKYSNSYCEVLVVDVENKKCKTSYVQYLKIAKVFQPDILFILSRTMRGESPPVPEDPLLQEMKDTIMQYEKLASKRIYVLNSLPKVKSDHIRRLNSFIRKNTTETGDFGVKQTYKFGQERIREAVKSCKKCHLFDFNSLFIGRNGTINFFDPFTKLSYFTSGVHLTATGLELVRPIFQVLAANVTGL